MIIKEDIISLFTILRKETIRFLRIWPQSLFPPIVNQSLYFLIFGKFIGSQIREINDVSYMAFIVPGLVMMAVINNSYMNVVSSFFSSKFQRSIEELLVSPAPKWVIICGFVGGGVFRGIIVGFLVFCVSILFTHPQIHNIGLIIFFVVITSIVFALGGLLNGIVAKKFDDISIIPTFVLIPLTYLGGVFYSVNSLPNFWQTISKLNPILYMVNGFRYGFYGFSDVNIFMSIIILIVFAMILLVIILTMLHKGVGLKT